MAHRRLVVNADDFGRSHEVNAAVLEAFQRGILTTASLMVTGEAATAAVELARQHPGLGVGLHLTLVAGRPVLPPAWIPGLLGSDGRFDQQPVRAGLRYYFRRDLREQLRRELAAQFERFRETGLVLDHVNGHLNLHLHPVVLKLLLESAGASGWQRLRLTRDPLGLNLRLAGGRWLYRFSHALVFAALCASARPQLKAQGIRHTRAVFGLLQSGRINEAYLLRLLPRLPVGDTEIYAHPSWTEAPGEVEALLSVRVQALLARLDIERIRYQDL